MWTILLSWGATEQLPGIQTFSTAVGSGHRLDINLDILFWWLAGKPERPEETRSDAGNVSPPWELNPGPLCCRAAALNCLRPLLWGWMVHSFSKMHLECLNCLCISDIKHTPTHTQIVCSLEYKSTFVQADDTSYSWHIVTAASSC